MDKFDEHKAGELITKTIELFNASKLSTAQVHKMTGIGLHWLRKFKQGKFNHPSVNRTEFLYQFFTGQKLDL